MTLALVAMLLWFNTGSAVEVAIVLLAVPFSVVGAVWIVWLLGYHMSVAVWVGLIALAGLDAETGVVMLLYLTLAQKHAPNIRRPGCHHRRSGTRVRPVDDGVVRMIGLLPVL